jgi:hypothetical protein
MLDLDLTSVRAKLARSQEHAQAINNEIRAWHGRHPYSLIKKRNSDSTRHSLIVRINEPARFESLSLMAADCLSNLRSALDHLIYAIAVHECSPNTLADKIAKKLMFPITDSEDRFNDAINRGTLGNISSDVRAAVKRVQPYVRKHEKLPPLLAILRDLNDINKHRLLMLVYGSLASEDLGFGGMTPLGSNFEVSRFDGEIKDKTEIFALTSNVPTPEMNWDRTVIELVVTIWHGKRDPADADGTDNNEVTAVLDLLTAEVRSVVYIVESAVR